MNLLKALPLVSVIVLSVPATPLLAQWRNAATMTTASRSRLGAADQININMAGGSLTIVGTEDSVVRYLVVKGRPNMVWVMESDRPEAEETYRPAWAAATALKPGTGTYTEKWDIDGLTLTSADSSLDVPIGIRVEVPRGVKSLRITARGSVLIKNFDGAISVKNSRGNIKLDHTAGSVFAETAEGDIRAIIAKLPPKGGTGLEFRGNASNILITLPANPSASIELETERGTAYSDFPPSSTTFRLSSEREIPRLERKVKLYAPVGGAGTRVRATTLDGHIMVTRADPGL